MVIDDDKVKDGKAGCLRIRGETAENRAHWPQRQWSELHTEPSHFLPHHCCFFHPIYYTIMTKILTSLMLESSIHLWNFLQRTALWIFRLKT
jgi:hypothetical protein